MSEFFAPLPASSRDKAVAHRPFRAFRGDEPYAFVCYAHADADEVYADLVHLHANGVRIWYDEGIEPGTDWRDEIAHALANCALFLFFVSNRSITSVHCRQELNFALNRKRRVLVVHLERVALPAALEFSLADRQAIERHQYARDDYCARLLDSINERGQQRPTSDPEAANTPERSIAVLPLRTLGPDDDFLGEGIAAELVAGLTRIQDLRVAPRSASFAQAKFRDDPARIARNLNVRHVLEGTLRRAGSRLRVTMDLLDAITEETLWSKRFDRVFDDIFDVQAEIADAVAEALESEFGRGVGSQIIDIGTRDPLAYQAYLMACHSRFRLTPDAIAETEAHLRDAIEADPDFLEAHVLLIAMLEARQRFYGSDVSEQISVVEALARDLDPQRERVNWFWTDRARSLAGPVFSDPDQDEALFREMILHSEHPAAQGMNPDRWFASGFDVSDQADPADRPLSCYALLLGQAGLYELALEYFERSNCDSFAISACMLALHREEEAIAFLAEYQDRRPDVILPRVGLATVLHRVGRRDEAAIEIARLDPLLNDDLRCVLRIQIACWNEDATALRLESARIPDLQIPVFFKALMTLYSDTDLAVERMWQAWQQKDILLRNVRLFVPFYLPPRLWRPMFEHPRFCELMDRLAMGESWQQELDRRARALIDRLDRGRGPMTRPDWNGGRAG